jgi:hypothetical protein
VQAADAEPSPLAAAEDERAARAARRTGQTACNALGAAARLAARRGAVKGCEELRQLAQELRGEAREIADCIRELPPPTRRANRRAARARVALARREARLARRRARGARVASDDVRARLRAVLRRERAARGGVGRVGAGARWRWRREGARLARAEERAEAAVCALVAALVAGAGCETGSGEVEPAAAETGEDSEGAAPGQVPRPPPPALLTRGLFDRAGSPVVR